MQDSLSEISLEGNSTHNSYSQEELEELLQEIQCSSKEKEAKNIRLQHEQKSSCSQADGIDAYEKELFALEHTLAGKTFEDVGIPLLIKIEAFLQKPETNLEDLKHCRAALSKLKTSLVKNCTLSKENKNMLEQQIALYDQKACELINVLEATTDAMLDMHKNSSVNFEKVNLCHKLLTEVGIPKLQDLEQQLKTLVNQVETLNQQREDLLFLKKELNQDFDKKAKTISLTDEALNKINTLNESGITLITLEENEKKISLGQLAELKEQISSQTSNLQLQQQTKFTTEIQPLITEKTIITETLKAILRYDTRTHETFVHNQKTNG